MDVKKLGATHSELLDVYSKQCRSIMELAVPVWTAGLTLDDCTELERVQKTACAIILGRSYNGYQDALEVLQIKSLKDSRKDSCLSFAKNTNSGSQEQKGPTC